MKQNSEFQFSHSFLPWWEKATVAMVAQLLKNEVFWGSLKPIFPYFPSLGESNGSYDGSSTTQKWSHSWMMVFDIPILKNSAHPNVLIYSKEMDWEPSFFQFYQSCQSKSRSVICPKQKIVGDGYWSKYEKEFWSRKIYSFKTGLHKSISYNCFAANFEATLTFNTRSVSYFLQ